MIPEGNVYNAQGRINRISVLVVNAYEVAVKNGFTGTVDEWLESLVGDTGKSAYEYAKENGYEGTEEEFAEDLSLLPGIIKNASTAIQSANTAAGKANTATQNANTAAQNANSAATAANNARVSFLETAGNALEEIRNVVNDGADAPPIVSSAKGEVITLNDSADRLLRGLKVFGKTEQRTTTGKNLLETNINTVYTGNGNNVRIFDSVEIDGGFQSNLQYTFSLTFRTNNVVTSATGNLIYFESVYTDGTTLYNGIDGSITSGILTFSSVSGKTLQKVMVYTAARFTSGSVEITNAQIEKGSTATAYEPYTGGKPSPNPDYPQELESVGDSVNVTVCGKNLLKNTAKSQTVNSVTFTVNEDGSVIVNGTATAFTAFVVGSSNRTPELDLKNGKYILSGCPNNGAVGKYYLQAWNIDGNTTAVYDTGSGIAYDFTNEGNDYNAAIVISSGTTATNLKFYPMIRLASVTDATYEPYKETQILPISTPVDGSGNSLLLPGIPVESGGNYTDPVTGKQWICDEVDFEKGVYVQRMAQYHLNGTEGTVLHSVTDGLARFNYFDLKAKVKGGAMCNRLSKYGGNNTVNTYEIHSAEGYIIIRTNIATTVAEWSAWLAANPIDIIVELEQENPIALSAGQLAAFAALHSNYPNTTVFNDKNAGMEVKYVADTKLYIDKKFAELSTALLNQ